MNPGLNIALAVELGRRVILELLSQDDRVDLIDRNWIPPVPSHWTPYTTA